MNSGLNRIKTVDTTLRSMSHAGYHLDEDAVAFVWKAALGEATQAEIDKWTEDMSKRLGAKPLDPTLFSDLETLGDEIRSRFDWVGQRLMAIASRTD